MSNNEELGALLANNVTPLKKNPSFYGIRSHLKKFYELSFSSESDQMSPLSADNAPATAKSSKCSAIGVVKCLCRLCILIGSLAILVGISLLIAVFSSPVESPILSPANSTVEKVDIGKMRHNNQLELLQAIGVYLLLGGSVMLLFSTIIAIAYLIAVSCFGNSQKNNNLARGYRPYIYDSGDY